MVNQMILAADAMSLSDKLSTAGRNTLICVAIVFLVLIFMSLVISLFKFINKAESAVAKKKAAKTKDKDESVAIESVNNAVAQIESREESELELVAVIAAAIAAHTGQSTDDFVVRSIRKINR